MKLMIVSDIHGSFYYAKELLKVFQTEKADKLVILGDVYNHGPRNCLPKDYNPAEVANLLNSVKDKLLVVKGNCDSEVDKMISEFQFLEDLCVLVDGKTVFLTHGHVFNENALPASTFDAIIYGHFHTGFIKQKNGTVFANAGSVSLPKNGTANSYLILEKGNLTLKDLSGKIIEQTQI